jgi:adenine-specific DNA-methyltransferase
LHTAQDALLQLTGRQKHLWNDFEESFPTEQELVAAALLLGAAQVRPWSDAENELAAAAAAGRKKLSALWDLIRAGYDPLGEAFCALRSPVERREHGATYTG